jgi:queuosine precursor transporter
VARINSYNLFSLLCGLFVTALIVSDIIGAKLFTLGPVDLYLPGIPQYRIPSLLMTAGILTFPMTFILTDLIHEFYGKKGARFVTYLGLGMAVFTYLILSFARILPTSPDSPIPQETFNLVFGLSGRMFIASLLAYLLAQLLDIQVFHFFKSFTHARLLWLRTTGSTVISQLLDSFTFCMVSFSGTLPFEQILQIAMTNYGVKFLVAVALTPLCYLGHAAITRFMSDAHPHEVDETNDRLTPYSVPNQEIEPTRAIISEASVL